MSLLNYLTINVEGFLDTAAQNAYDDGKQDITDVIEDLGAQEIRRLELYLYSAIENWAIEIEL